MIYQIEIIFDKGDFIENENSLFLEAFIICEKNYQDRIY